MEFGQTGITATLVVKEENDRIALKVISVSGKIESLTFLNVPLNLEAQPYETFGACALSMNLFTHVRLLPPLQSELWATCYNRFGLQDAEVILLGLPPN
jgi:hypothetical protein